MKTAAFSILLLCISIFTYAQTGKISGQIINAKTGTPISGATIQDDRFAVVRGLNDRYNAAFKYRLVRDRKNHYCRSFGMGRSEPCERGG